MTTKKLDRSVQTFLDSYIETALLSSTDMGDDSTYLGDNYGPEDIHPDTLKAMTEECECFVRDNMDDIMTYTHNYYPDRCMKMAGHDFWLTRCGHGAGFWDGDWGYAVGKRLTAASEAWGNVDLYVGDDGMIHQV